MREYELIYVIQPDAADEREQEIHSRIDGFIEGGKGQILLRDDWGKRKLAYEIQKFQKGHYFQLNFLGDGSFVGDVERELRLDPDVLRFLTVQASEHVDDIPARVALAEKQAAEQARRREERERLEAERAAEEEERADRMPGPPAPPRREQPESADAAEAAPDAE